ncbi:hypothetical protein OH76DRAFT_1356133 [Lentinus brumalis]|uniref:CxC2-like cysteine cluster KDZ transposase-associated domain-containing protein n=1 Tax=Lentinus brumalis TaxID=2498619 RepID=A0A371D1K3_9APHY|nr:hypothetical protein OH76DRAFT_1356133 [Polyporus brumalis]
MTIVHDHGIHEYQVRFCLCPQETTLLKIPEPLQLIHAGLWPGSWSLPSSAYTISVLRDHHLLSLQSQISAFDYVGYLERLTDNVVSDDIPDRYREFMTAAREFSFMRATKRFGVEPSSTLPPGSMAVLCPACPQPGINMDPVYEATGRPKGEEFLDALFHTCDGNFQQNQKMKPMDEEDLPLTLGACFYADERDFATYLAQYKRKQKESTTCHKFGAMGYGRYGGRVSGVVGLSCARHMLALPNAVVDLNAGEAYAYVDYVQLSGLQRYMKLRMHVAGYDINCQYRIHFASRMQSIRERFDFLPSIRLTHFPPTLIAIGKFHLAAHIPRCRYKFSYNFLPGVGMTDGEALERIWGEVDGLAVRTKEMTPGHRHDTQNDHYNDMNIRRITKMPGDLVRRHLNAVARYAVAKAHLADVSKDIPEAQLEEMQAEEKTWLADVVDMAKHDQLPNPYELKVDRGLTTKELLMETEKTRTRLGSGESLDVLDTIFDGVQLQSMREDLLDAIEDDDGSDDSQKTLLAARSDLLVQLHKWTSAFNTTLQPALEIAAQAVQSAGEAKVRNGEKAEALPASFPLRDTDFLQPSVTSKAARAALGLPPLRNEKNKSDLWQEVYALEIPLPSSFDHRVLAEPVVETFLNWERRVRQAQMNDALNDVCTHMVTSEMLKLKKLDTTGKGITTRMGKRIRRKHDQVLAAADEYRRGRMAMLALGMDEDDPLFRPLRKQDLTKFTMSSEHQQLGESNRGVSWIWEDFSYADKQGDERYKQFHADVRRVHWFRTSALCKRWWEEERLVREEMNRTVRFFVFYRNLWTDTSTLGSDKSASAYARKQAHRYSRLLETCRKHFSKTTCDIVSGDGCSNELEG